MHWMLYLILSLRGLGEYECDPVSRNAVWSATALGLAVYDVQQGIGDLPEGRDLPHTLIPGAAATG